MRTHYLIATEPTPNARYALYMNVLRRPESVAYRPVGSLGGEVGFGEAAEGEEAFDRVVDLDVGRRSTRGDADFDRPVRKPVVLLDFVLLVNGLVSQKPRRHEAIRVGDVVGGKPSSADLGEMIGVAGVVTADNEHHVHALIAELDDGILSFLSGATDGVEGAKSIFELRLAEAAFNRLAQPSGNGERVAAEHRRLIRNSESLKVSAGVESC